jgi:20S proteasome alpha/beta subunit
VSESTGVRRLTQQISYHAEPSGTFYRYDAKAIGSGSEGAQAELVNEYHKYVFSHINLFEEII